MGGSPLGLPPLAHPPASPPQALLPPSPFPPTACQAPPFPLLSPFQEKVFLTDSELCGRCRLRDLGRISPRPPPSSPPPPPFPPTACQAPPFPSSRPSKIQEKVFLTNSGGRCRLSDFGRISPLAHPPASPPQALLPSPLSRPSKIQEKGPPLSPFGGVAISEFWEDLP